MMLAILYLIERFSFEQRVEEYIVYKMKLKIIKQHLLLLLVLCSVCLCRQIQHNLPVIQEQLLPDQIKQYRIQEQQSFIMECSPQSVILGKLHHECHIHPAQIQIDTLSQIDYDNTQKKKYLYNPNSIAIYILSDTEFVIHSIGAQHHKQKDKQIFQFSSNCSKDMAFQYGKEKIFVFSCEAIYQMALHHTVQMKQVMKNQQLLDIRSAERFEDLIIVITYNKGILIYAVDFDLKLVNLGNVQLNSQQQRSIVDCHYANGQLVLLDKDNGLLYFERYLNKFIKIDDLSIKLQQQIEYQFIEIWKNSTFIAISAQTESFVAELQTIKNKTYLVRYFKGYDDIIKIQIINDSLIIHSDSKIHQFPINRDPRTIKQAFNGYSYSHDESVLSFEHLNENKYLLLRARSVSIAEWSFIDKKIQCDFSETGDYSIMLEHPCGININQTFRETCQRISMVKITVFHKDSYIWLLLIVAGGFVAAVLALIFWRQQKVNKIVQILKKTNNFKLKKKEIQLKQINYDSGVESVKKKQDNQIDIQSKEDHNQEMDPYQEYMQSQRNNLN